MLAGHSALALVAACILAIPLSLLLLWRYRRAVLAAMRRSSPLEAIASDVETAPCVTSQRHVEFTVRDGRERVSCNGPAARTLRRGLAGRWRVAVVYMAAALAQAAVIAVAWRLKTGAPVFHGGTLVNTWIYFWPVVLIVGIALSGGRRVWLSLGLAYLAAYLILVSLTFGDGMAAPMLAAFAQIALPPTLVLLPFLHRRLRAVGPVVLAALLLASGGALVVLNMVVQTSGAAVAPSTIGAPATTTEPTTTTELLALAAGFLVFGACGWQAAGMLGKRYQAKKFGDQSLVLDLVALIFALYQSAMLSASGWTLAGPASFVAFKLVSAAGFSIARRRVGDRRNVKLLLLRVFGNPRRSERLMTTIGGRWRHVGSIQLIAGTDLATTTVTPHDFLEFAGGRLGRRYIGGPEDLERRLLTQDLEPDPDGRYRLNEFFCHANTWQMTVARVAATTDAVLMDLREFSAARQGCAFEIGALVELVPMARVVFVVDRTTDLQLLRDTLERACSTVPAHSPNTSGAVRIMLVRMDREDAASVRLVLSLLALAAAPAVAPAAV